ncbi:melanoma-associated antigen B4-like [Perognathus longimembris pacificus]|uniref:melanoma-associated antigen B4-like n=1 Tax=Perognathus longimembris pacificus TaxID=214514 RepID=UPI0020193CC0|nr:melanoma-associated antigen B4-like [Perognathus longimembris pacificus]
MPRGQKSRQRMRAKRYQARGRSRAVQEVKVEEDVQSATSSISDEDAPPSPPDICTLEHFWDDMPSCSSNAGVACSSSCAGLDEGASATSVSIFSEGSITQRVCTDPIARKTRRLVQYLLEKYKSKERVTQADMLKVIKRKHKQHFPDMFRNARARMELVFSVELQEVGPNSQCYTLVSKFGNVDANASGWVPKTGLVMTLLGVIFMNGNHASEEEMWDFLNAFGIQAGRKHLIFGEPRKLITKDLVHDGYLEYRQVPNTIPARYEYLWGFRARAEITKMRVLEVLAKITDTVPKAFPLLYDEAIREQEGRGRDRIATGDRFPPYTYF